VHALEDWISSLCSLARHAGVIGDKKWDALVLARLFLGYPRL